MAVENFFDPWVGECTASLVWGLLCTDVGIICIFFSGKTALSDWGVFNDSLYCSVTGEDDIVLRPLFITSSM